MNWFYAVFLLLFHMGLFLSEVALLEMQQENTVNIHEKISCG